MKTAIGKRMKTTLGEMAKGYGNEKKELVICRVESELLLSPLPCGSQKIGD